MGEKTKQVLLQVIDECVKYENPISVTVKKKFLGRQTDGQVDLLYPKISFVGNNEKFIKNTCSKF